MHNGSASGNVPDTSLSYDRIWLSGCKQSLLWRENEFAYLHLLDTCTGQEWEAIRAPSQSESAVGQLEAIYNLPLKPEWAVVPLGLLRTVDGPLVVYPHVSPANLPNLLDTGKLSLTSFLSIAQASASALAQAHMSGVLHGNLRPEQLVIMPGGAVKLRGFRPPPLSTPSIEKLWPYQAPEQSILKANHLDARSDIYALGTILYQAVCGQLPLSAVDAIQWRYAHTAVQPPSPCVVDPSIPKTVGDILLKAIAKDPDARYQSAESLASDLIYCLKQWQGNGQIEAFNLGRSDPLAGSARQQKLVGRDREREQIKECLRRTGYNSASEVLLVSGPAGSGKSALVHEVLTEIPGIYCASGKSSLLYHGVPYAPWSQIFISLTEQLLGKDRIEVENTARKLLEQLNGRGRLLADLSPHMEMVIGPTASLPALPARHAHERANSTLLSALSAFAKNDQPLVLFFDDIQWADESTLSLLKAFLASPPQNVLLILAYRDDEAGNLIKPNGLVSLALHNASMMVNQLHMQPLPVAAVAALLAINLEMRPEETQALAELIHVKTAGNPFFVNQMLCTMIDDHIIRFDTVSRRCVWSVDEVARQSYADNVVDLMINRLDRLPAAQRELLRVAGCIGERLDNDLLAHVAGLDVEEMCCLANELVNAGLLQQEGQNYVFPHDRVLEAAYNLTPDSQRESEHTRIAIAMQHVFGANASEAVFEIANHIQRASTQMLSCEQVRAFISLLVDAARRAKNTSAIEQAAGYLETAKQLMGSTGWTDWYPEAFATHWHAAECALLLAQLDKAHLLIDECLVASANACDKALTYRLQATLFTLHSDYEGAITAALEGLKLLETPLQRKPCPSELDAAYDRIRLLIGDRSISELSELPKASNPPMEITMELLSTLTSSFFISDGISFLHLAKMVELTLLHGITPGCCYGFSWFGVMISARYDAYEDGFEFGKLALSLLEKHGYEAARTATLVAIDQISPWTISLDYARARAREALASGYGGGDLAMACYACNHIVSDLLIMGERLPEVLKEIDSGLSLVRQFRYIDIERILRAQQTFALDMQKGQPVRSIEELDRPESDEFGLLDKDKVSQPTLFWIYLYSGMSAFYYGHIDYALRRFADAAPLAWSLPAHINLSDFHLFYALAQASPVAPGDTATKLQRLERHRERFVVWNSINPKTFRNRLFMVDGFIAKLRGQYLVALHCFDQAGIAAAASGFVHEQALAHELMAEMCEVSGLVTGANLHFRVARDCYRLWGAFGKVQQLETAHSFLASEPIVRPTDQASMHTGIDLAVGIQAARALSEEVLLDRLVKTLMNHLMVHAGAERGILLTVNQGDMALAAIANLSAGEVVVHMHSGQPTSEHAPMSVLYATMRTCKPHVFEDVQKDCPEAHRTDLGKSNARSVLCMPLLKQGTLIGLIYLENNQASGVFCKERLTMLEILASQAAVSIETAQLYARLVEDNQVRARVEAELLRSQTELARVSHLTVMGELSASIAHELSQPLLAIVSNAGASLRWLKRDQSDIEEAIAGLEGIRSDGIRASNILQALRSLAKQAPPNLQVIFLDRLVLEVLRLTASATEKLGVKLDISLTANTATLADPVQIQQVIYNLVTNALDALESVPQANRRLVIASRVENDTVEVSIEDTGPGIAVENRERVFDVFYTTKTEGMGIGLAICRSIVKAHGGSITLGSEASGCRICFSLSKAP
jgi:predicted ATPase/signal transduction histidine kinase